MFVLALCVLATFVNCFFMAPEIVNCMINVFEMEKESGVAYAVGYCDRTELKKNPLYCQYYKQFRRVHGLAGITNMVTLVCNIIYLYHLACVWKITQRQLKVNTLTRVFFSQGLIARRGATALSKSRHCVLRYTWRGQGRHSKNLWFKQRVCGIQRRCWWAGEVQRSNGYWLIRLWFHFFDFELDLKTTQEGYRFWRIYLSTVLWYTSKAEEQNCI